MKSLMKSILCITLAAIVFGCQDTKQQATSAEPKTDKEKTSYAIGMDMAESIVSISEEIDVAMLKQGISDQIQGKELLVSKEEAGSLLQALMEKLRAKQQEEIARTSQDNLEAGQAFLKDNESKEGVVTTESGLQYIVLKEGEGKSPKAFDRVKVHYKGTKLDGTVFDSSYDRGNPATFKVDGVIEGWTEALQLMKEGGKCKLFIPANLAYGERGAGQAIGPNEVLVFEVELLEIIEEQPENKQAE